MSEGDRTSISVNEGFQTELPCVTQNPIFNNTNNVHQVRWYHEPHYLLGREPIYTVDFGASHSPYSADRTNLNQVVRWTRKEWLGRIYFSLVNYPYTLKIINLRYEDMGTYICSVHFRDGSERNSTIYLQVIVPPEPPVITDVQGNVLSGVIGPYNESSRLNLICNVKGGRPAPTITWKRNGEVLDVNAMSSISGDMKKSTLTLHSLHRHDLMAVYTCVSSNNVSVQGDASVTLDLNLSPSTVQIRRTEAPISACLPAEILCEVWGSKPPPEITWWKNSVQLKHTFVHVSQDGNLTTSVVEFIPEPNDNGQSLVCRAENTRMPGSVREDLWDLNVHYQPKLRLQMDPNLSLDNIREGTTIALNCRVDANPRVGEVQWQVDNNDLHSQRGVTVHKDTLTVSNARLLHSGNYTCTAANKEGIGLSNAIDIRVKHSPICRPGQRLVYATKLLKTVHVSCEVIAQPPSVSFEWKFNNSIHSSRLDSHTRHGTRSIARYVARSPEDYGTLLCWARNQIGDQKQPCVFMVVPAASNLLSEEALVTVLICLLFVLVVLVAFIYLLFKWRRGKQNKDEQRPKTERQPSQDAAVAVNNVHSLSRNSNGDMSSTANAGGVGNVNRVGNGKYMAFGRSTH
ncbi:neuronal cell adhesion molecule-like isoform X2 [Ornithodoros turicata]|uniref:neuronal cell adhesion molecule-like isoform X2 n=1 Tax=Ornithodoros turicata TaxID=34597 RepID=UPI003138CE88